MLERNPDSAMDVRRNDPLWEDRRWWGNSSAKHPIEATPRAISSSGSSIGFHPPSCPGFISSASSLRSSPCSSPQAELGDDLYFLTISRAGPGRPSSNPVVAPARLQVSDGCVPEGSARAHPSAHESARLQNAFPSCRMKSNPCTENSTYPQTFPCRRKPVSFQSGRVVARSSVRSASPSTAAENRRILGCNQHASQR